MDQANRKESYLAKAEEAEREAANARDAKKRAGWLKIAENYRLMAKYE